MKEKLTLRNVVVWGAAFLGLLFFFLSFAACATMKFNVEGSVAEYVFKNAIWSGDHIVVKANGVAIEEGNIVGSPFALPIVGIILVLVAALGAIVVSFLIKDEKIKKFGLIGAGVLSILGGVFVFFVGETAVRNFCVLTEMPLSKLEWLKSQLTAAGTKWGPNALPVIIGIVAILAGIGYGASEFLPDKKLVK